MVGLGNDILDGGAGADRMEGGRGALRRGQPRRRLPPERSPAMRAQPLHRGGRQRQHQWRRRSRRCDVQRQAGWLLAGQDQHRPDAH
ncbi:MAG: hypothetical protein IPO19_18250 [Rhodoferax sp.]|nr:hypothetical protein [Rhodoferax sp.]